MLKAQAFVGRVAARGTLTAWLLLASGPDAFALNPALDVSQYAHTAWRVREGFSRGPLYAIAQTPDGYLWLGTEFGLLRFDGVRTVTWQPPPDQELPSNRVTGLCVTRDGTLWIATSNGLASWKDGKLTQFAAFAGQVLGPVIEDREGSVWAAVYALGGGKLCAIQKDKVRCEGEGRLGSGVNGLYEDRDGSLWVGAESGLWRWKPGPLALFAKPSQLGDFDSFAEGRDGALLVTTRDGIRRLVGGRTESYLSNRLLESSSLRLLHDRDGGLWIGTSTHGLVHEHQGKLDVFTQPDGLSGNYVSALFEDREGNIWVATSGGIDRFREYSVTTVSVNQGLSSPVVGAVLAARDGSVWLGTTDGLNRWNDGEVAVFVQRRVPATTGVRQIVGSGLPDNIVESLFQDGRGRIWVSTSRGVAYLENDRFITVSAVPAGYVRSIAEDTRGDLWIANLNLGLFRVARAGSVQQIPWTTLGRKDFATTLVADRAHGGIWLGFYQGGIAYFNDGQTRATYASANGLGEGRVSYLRLDQDGTLWAATDGGLSRLKTGRVATLSSRNGLPCDPVQWVIEDDAQSFWLNMPCGLVRIARPELDAWAATVDNDKDPKRTLKVTVFDSSDGVRSTGLGGGYSPPVAKFADGRLWFTTWTDGVSVVDPRRLPFNNLPPPVHIEQVIADRKTYDADWSANGRISLPALTRDLQIDYTALSLVAPEKNRFRVKLEGWDQEWQDVGTRRQAFYNNLPPRKYRFRVTASNNSGVWNEAGTFLDFSVAPAYYQTTWFRWSLVAAFLALLGALHQLRLRQVAYQFNLRLEERVNERTRIARDLHDTLLQSFHGLLFRFQAATNLLPDRPAEAKQQFESAIDQAAQAITEGRDAVQNLRSSTTDANDLAVAISTLGEELMAGQTPENNAGTTSPTVIDVALEGTPRSLHPILRDDVYRIAGEALRNAFRHARARRIEVEIRYDDRQFQLRVRDDGKGIDPTLLEEPRAGHFGLSGMRERAELIGGRLDVWSEVGLGTELDLKIPAVAAYAKPRARGRFFGKRTGTES